MYVVIVFAFDIVVILILLLLLLAPTLSTGLVLLAIVVMNENGVICEIVADK